MTSGSFYDKAIRKYEQQIPLMKAELARVQEETSFLKAQRLRLEMVSPAEYKELVDLRKEKLELEIKLLKEQTG